MSNIMGHYRLILASAIVLCGFTACQPVMDNRITLVEKPGSRSLKEGLAALSSTPSDAQMQKAEAAFKKAMTSTDSHIRSQAVVAYARLYASRHGSYSPELLQQLNRTALEDNSAEAGLLLARLYITSGQTQQALPLLKAYPDEPEAQEWTGRILLTEGKAAEGKAAMVSAINAYNRLLVSEKDPHYHLLLGRIYNDTSLPFHNPDIAFHHYQQAARHSLSESYEPLAEIYRNGNGTLKNPEKAIEYYGLLAQQGNLKAIRLLAEAWQPQGWYREDIHQEIRYQQVLAEAGRTSSMKRMATIYALGLHGSADVTQAQYWLDKLVATDRKQAKMAVSLLRRSASPQMAMLARRYEAYLPAKTPTASKTKTAKPVKIKPPVTLAEANQVAAILQEQPSRGNRNLWERMATIYLQEGQPQQGIIWLKEAAAAGSITSMKQLAGFYAVGLHVSQDFREALKWHLKAASLGDKDAQYQAGLAYARGLGVTKDKEKAIYWLSRSNGGNRAAAEAIIESLSLSKEPS